MPPSQSPETHPSLIVRLSDAQNHDAWCAFISAYEVFLRQFCLRLGVPRQQLPDATQQILLTVLKSVADWKSDGQPESFRRWLQRLARNVVIKFMVQERRHPQGTGGSGEIAVTEPSDPRALADAERSYDEELIHWAAAQVRHEFHPSSWEAFWRTAIEQVPVVSVASDLGISPGAIYMARSRIVARIRSRISEIDDHI
ncbi:RNA polymerase sigma factor [Planctomicrobium sp. SH664]|uniref:RNA polymerase sigma factor n=1 Tax=Planctomicrobium sp. SH664 TaxID=3448125 RepID=UPI003F5C25C3